MGSAQNVMVRLTDTSISKRVPWYSYAQQDWIKADKATEFTGATYNQSTDTLREQRELGMKQYEMTDHLGNVLATVLDRKTGYGNSSGNYTGFSADVASVSDFYPGGFEMSERIITADNVNPFRFGLNGIEKSDEISGANNHYTAEFGEYDSKLMRRWNLDPKPNIDVSQYAIFNNNPIAFSDILLDSATATHKIIQKDSKKWNDADGEDYAWTNGDIVRWKERGEEDGRKYIYERKAAYIYHYKNVLQDAAKQFDIPVELLAGIAFAEFGGDPSWIDNVAYTVRNKDFTGLTKSPMKTSFGNISIQVYEAAKSLGYNPDRMSKDDINAVINSLKNPIQNIYIAAKHISDLKKIDYRDVENSQLSIQQFMNIATRFNRGRKASLESIEKNNSYGHAVLFKYVPIINQVLKKK